jgi:hypothetical protein
VAERGLPYEVPELKYVAVEPRSLARMRTNWDDWWEDQILIALCVRCGRRYTENPNRDAAGEPMHQDPEDDHEAVCKACLRKGSGEALEADFLFLMESKLGLEERHREALRSFIETVFTDPQKILQIKDLDKRVRELEKQNGRLWVALGITAGLVAISIAAVVAIALALAS